MYRMSAGLITATVLAIAGATAGEALKSGPQTGQSIAGPFNVLNNTGKNAGKSNCLV